MEARTKSDLHDQTIIDPAIEPEKPADVGRRQFLTTTGAAAATALAPVAFRLSQNREYGPRPVDRS